MSWFLLVVILTNADGRRQLVCFVCHARRLLLSKLRLRRPHPDDLLYREAPPRPPHHRRRRRRTCFLLELPQLVRQHADIAIIVTIIARIASGTIAAPASPCPPLQPLRSLCGGYSPHVPTSSVEQARKRRDRPAGHRPVPSLPVPAGGADQETASSPNRAGSAGAGAGAATPARRGLSRASSRASSRRGRGRWQVPLHFLLEQAQQRFLAFALSIKPTTKHACGGRRERRGGIASKEEVAEGLEQPYRRKAKQNSNRQN